MRLLADENIPRAVIDAVRAAGHDIAWVTDAAAGADDRSVERIAAAEARAILTFDKDFGDLAVRGGLARFGVVLLRFTPVDAAEAASLVLAALAQLDRLDERLVLIERDRMRVRHLPP